MEKFATACETTAFGWPFRITSPALHSINEHISYTILSIRYTYSILCIMHSSLLLIILQTGELFNSLTFEVGMDRGEPPPHQPISPVLSRERESCRAIAENYYYTYLQLANCWKVSITCSRAFSVCVPQTFEFCVIHPWSVHLIDFKICNDKLNGNETKLWHKLGVVLHLSRAKSGRSQHLYKSYTHTHSGLAG